MSVSKHFSRMRAGDELPTLEVKNHSDGDVAVAPARLDDPIPLVKRSFKRTRRRIISLLVMLAIWQVASLFFTINVLPGPIPVTAALWENLKEGDTYYQLFKTMERVLGGMTIAVVLGLIVGLIMGLSKLGEDLLDSWVLVAFTIPSVVFGILCILWFGLNDLAAIIAIGAAATPAIAINIWQGAKAIDHSLVNMGKAFHFSRRSIMTKVIVPQLVPYVLAAFRYALGISWKIATVVELIGLSSGVGYQLNYWFGLFNMTQVLAWTMVFTITLLLIEFLILKPIETRLTRWRPVSQMQKA
jgi:NitT/TauT family transport system permease protein